MTRANLSVSRMLITLYFGFPLERAHEMSEDAQRDGREPDVPSNWRDVYVPWLALEIRRGIRTATREAITRRGGVAAVAEEFGINESLVRAWWMGEMRAHWAFKLNTVFGDAWFATWLEVIAPHAYLYRRGGAFPGTQAFRRLHSSAERQEVV